MAAVKSFFKGIAEWFKSLFWQQSLEITLVGLHNAGKTTLVESIANGEYQEDTIPTVGFNMRKINKGNVSIKLWDIGGQPRFRSMWGRYCNGVNAIVFVVDSADVPSVAEAREELQALLGKAQLDEIPLLVLGNKNDVDGHLDAEELVQQLGLDEITDREVACYSISAKNQVNIDITLEWLTQHASTE